MTYISPIPWTRINDSWISPGVGHSIIPEVIRHPLISGLPNNVGSRFQASFYSKVALDIVTETVYNYYYPYISEKTLRPIACKRMFIIVGAPGILDLLHQKGFITFGDVVDESYDSIQDPVLRWRALEKSIEDFVTKPLTEIKEIINLKKEILDHNFNVLINLQDEEIKCLE